MDAARRTTAIVWLPTWPCVTYCIRSPPAVGSTYEGE